MLRKSIGIRLKESKTVIEGEVVEINIERSTTSNVSFLNFILY
jgi:DNA helicase TIP49 (TBP-interacting protein)